jgi:integrase
MQLPWVDLDSAMILVVRGKGRRDRFVPIHERLVADLWVWAHQGVSGPLFRSRRGGPLSNEGISDVYLDDLHGAAGKLSPTW